MDIYYYLVNRDIETVATNFFECDYSEDLLYKGNSMSDLKKVAKAYPQEDLTVISCGSNFFTGYSYKSWVRRFARD